MNGKWVGEPILHVQQDQDQDELKDEESIKTIRARIAKVPPRKKDDSTRHDDEDD